jgi:hypothetical protein
MPIEIRELVIKAAVTNNNEGGGKSAASSNAAEDMVQLSLEQISEMKRKEKER